jgi:tetratricopeptide (TPR) repeat protein
MNRPAKVGPLALMFAAISLLPTPAAQTGQVETKNPPNAETEKAKREEAKSQSKLIKTHFQNGNQAMRDAQAVQQQLQTATDDQKPALRAGIKADYQTAITEYQHALEDITVRDENGVRVIGLIGIIRNGLISQEKAVEMLVQDKDLPVILSNLGMAYGGAGQYQEAITILQQAAILKPAAGTYIELGTDLALVGRIPEATATCDKVPTTDLAAKNASGVCYKNIAVVLMNQGKLAEAIAPLQKATQRDPQDALAWKLLGDVLSNSVSTASENGKIVYVIPAGTIEAYHKYLQLEPSGPYAGQVRSALEELMRLTNGARTPAEK